MRPVLTMLLATLFLAGCPEDKKTDGDKPAATSKSGDKPAATSTASAKSDEEGGW